MVDEMVEGDDLERLGNRILHACGAAALGATFVPAGGEGDDRQSIGTDPGGPNAASGLEPVDVGSPGTELEFAL